MTNEEKASMVAQMLLPSVVSESDLLPYITLAETIVLHRKFPFADVSEVPSKYDYIQCEIAVELWNKKGAEGETTHNENGINRNWESLVSDKLLNLIAPRCGSVRSENTTEE